MGVGLSGSDALARPGGAVKRDGLLRGWAEREADMQPMTAVPFDSDLADYEDQAEALLAAWVAGDKDAVALVHRRHPRFLDDKIKWLPKRMTDDEVRNSPFDIDDARL